jgi:nucleotide-binding universal stress UspA family protein
VSVEHIVVATDGSEASRQGIGAARAWGQRLGAEVTLYHVATRRPLPALALAAGPLVESEPAEHLETGVGIPGVEIPRFAERNGAGLVVVGRKPRARSPQIQASDTGDAVARRSTVPCLFVPGPLGLPAHLLVALDGTDRGLRVLPFALGIAEALGARLSGVVVEPPKPGEPAELASLVPSARAAALRHRLDCGVHPLIVRHGDPETEILRAAHHARADVIIIGYRRGGSPAPIQRGSVARRVAHCAPCAVLTVPL